MQIDQQRKALSVLLILSAVIGALVSAAAILYHFRDRLGISRLWLKKSRDSAQWKDCCCFTDEQCEEEEPAEEVPAEEKPADD